VTPERYTHGHHESVLRSHSWRTIANSAGYLEAYLRPGLRILDVGCGPGTITAEMADRVGEEGAVVGIDAAAEVIARASETMSRSNLTYAVEDVYALDADNDSFDIVHAHQVLQHLADPVAALTEMRRVCRPGGLVAARDSDYPTMAWHPQPPELTEWLALYVSVTRANGGHPEAGRLLQSWARQAGFADVTSSASAWCFATPGEREWWGGLWADRVVESSIAEQAVAAGFASPDDLERLSAAWRQWAAAADGWFAMLHGEILAVA
jgi:ubiquinone/menaquinone biosynthesis C-methylase UbiE